MYAVLTGDLVRSTKLSRAQLDQAMKTLADTAGAAGAWAGGNPRFTRQRGDGWQICLSRPEMALRVALCLRAALRALGKTFLTRISIATGPGDTGGAADLNAAAGAVFVASGHGLDRLEPPILMDVADGGGVAAAAVLADHISQHWTPRQAQVIGHFLVPDAPIRRQVADRLGISRQAVDQALAAAGYPALRAALARIEEHP